jgi:hypothetical protein
MHNNLFCYTFSCDISVVTRFLKVRGNVNTAYIINILVTSTCGKEIEYLKVVCNENQGGSGRWHTA